MAQYLVAKPLKACHTGLNRQTFDGGALARRFGIIYPHMSKVLLLVFELAKMEV